ncbi:hypothetical protein Agub_g6717, partial [Astrephomene gubernaculifera]
MGRYEIVPKYDGTNLRTFARKYIDLLAQEDIAVDVLRDAEFPNVTVSKKALGFLRRNVSRDFEEDVQDCETAKEAWDILQKLYNDAMKLQRPELKRRFRQLRFCSKEDKDIAGFFARGKALRNQLRDAGVEFTDTDLAEQILAGLPAAFEPIVTTINAMMAKASAEAEDGEEEDYNLEVVKKQLQTHESMMKQSAGNMELVNVARFDRPRGQPRTFPGQVLFNGVCFRCGKKGHRKIECRASKEQVQQFRQQQAQAQQGVEGQMQQLAVGQPQVLQVPQAQQMQVLPVQQVPQAQQMQAVQAQQQQQQAQQGRQPGRFRDYAAVAHEGGLFSKYPTLAPFILDSGATTHVTNSLADLHDFQWSSGGEISGLYGTSGKVEGSGTVVLVSGGVRFSIHDVQYVPGAQVKVISALVLADKGYESAVKKGGRSEVSYDGAVVLTASRREGSRLHYIDAEPLSVLDDDMLAEAMDTALPILDPLCLWHRRLGHLSYGGMEKLVRENMVEGLDLSLKQFAAADKVCEPCMLGKQPRVSFQSSSSTTSRPLELIHMDVCGPFPVESLNGNSYMVTFLDDYSGYSHLEFVRFKSDVPDVVKKVLVMFERQLDLNVKAVRTDRGREYVNRKLGEWFEFNGIDHEKTAPYTPEQNGKAERLNRSILEKVRPMLIDAGLKSSLWEEAATYASDVRNTSPYRNHPTTPYERLSGNKPDVSSLRVFGAKAYVHVPKQQRSKLDDVAVKGVFVGLEPKGRQFRVLVGGKIVVSSSVTFDERLPQADSTVGGSSSTSDDSWGLLLSPANVDYDVGSGSSSGGGAGSGSSSGGGAGSGSSSGGGAGSGSGSGGGAGSGGSGGNASSGSVGGTHSGSGGALGNDSGGGAGSGSGNGNGSGDGEESDDSGRSAAATAESSESAASSFKSLAGGNEDGGGGAGGGGRARHPPKWMTSGQYVVTAVENAKDQFTDKEARSGPYAAEFEGAKQAEIASLHANGTWRLEKPPAGARVLPVRWVLTIKRRADNSIERFKARLVVKGYMQREGIDFNEVFAPTGKQSTLRALLAKVAAEGLQLHHVDIKTAFLNGELEEEVYTDQPPGFENG